MNPTFMLACLLAAVAAFAWSANRRWQLLKIGQPENRLDQVPARLRALFRYAIGQRRMPRYAATGIAHIFIFVGFMVLLLRSLVLFGRGFVEGFDLWILEPGTWLGDGYAALKDVVAIAVLSGALVFVYLRVVKRPARMTLGAEGLVILGIICVMMLADIVYDGAELARLAHGDAVVWAAGAPAGTLVAGWLHGVRPGTLQVMEHAAFWTHVCLVLLFANLLPYSKHFHVITALPNVFALSLEPRGRLRPVPDIEDRVGEDRPVGLRFVDDLTWKGILDLYTCTECGRCTDHCPANKTGKLLSPKHLTLALRDHLYEREEELVDGRFPEKDEHGGHADAAHGDGHGDEHGGHGHEEPSVGPPKPLVIERRLVSLVPDVIKPEVLWACTTCRACEEECPVLISYVDKIVDLRRDLVAYGKDMPPDLQKPFDGMERNGNPWNFARMDRAAWAEGLDVKLVEEHPDAEILFWVGCAPSYDDRARKIARSFVRLLQTAGVDFAILGPEECCTGDPARRAGNEYLFQTLAQQNVETMNGHGIKKIVTTCPHCFNSLAHEYPDYGGRYEVVHHTTFLQELVAQGRLVPRQRVDRTVVFHDSCYLGRYNDIYAAPRRVLEAIPGVRLTEALDAAGGRAHHDRGLCCGAGGAQFWKEEEPGRTRVNFERADQLLATGAKIITSACPFCQTMILDGMKARDVEDVEQLDVVELLERSVAPEKASGRPEASPTDPARVAPASS